MRSSPVHASPLLIKNIAQALDYSSSQYTMTKNAQVAAILDYVCSRSVSTSGLSPDRKQVKDDLTTLTLSGGCADDFV